ncbi:MAG: cyclase family protein [Dissulfurispiraceae bacterium]|jgi:kynurenine formamidase|nr:cyclase family protein [Dissulfurispiraceae bacterium]
MMRYLSYELSPYTPFYGSTDRGVFPEKIKSMADGSSCDVHKIAIENHWGTHIDYPAHFFTGGKGPCDYDADYLFFRSPQVIPVHAEPNQILRKADLIVPPHITTDLLILRSGWGAVRNLDKYSLEGPGLDPEIGIWLRKEYPGIRAVGFDWISLSSYAHREMGREAHRVFLDPQGNGHPILVIEDMLIEDNLESLKYVWVVPLRISGIDSAPCTIIGVFE